MDDDEKLLQNRLSELSRRARERGRYVFTPFLTLAEQDVLCRMERRLDAPFVLWGGYDWAERRMACFGDREELGYDPDYPLCWLEIAPTAPRFAAKLSHRDYLGALMALGVKRETVGDLIVGDGRAWLCCQRENAPYFCENLTQAGRVAVSCREGEAPSAALEPPKESCVVVSSPRLDGLIAAVWDLSRAESQSLFPKELVFVNGRLETSPSRQPREGEIVSVRGIGRFSYEGVARETKKGRLRVTVRVFGR